MATYKLIQDIEAEDHILGPLSFRQFVFALIAVFLFYLSFLVVAKHVPFLLVVFLPPALFFGFFALPFGRDQPTEIWALAKLRYFLKPRQRIWDQSGIKELVTITVPKKIEHLYTDGLSQGEVKSRLSALANTLDSRGWAVKNMVTDAQPATVMSSDRLVDFGSSTQEVPSIDVHASDDILDESNNPIAQQFESMIDASTKTRRKELIDKMNSVRAKNAVEPVPVPQPRVGNPWFIPHPIAGNQPQVASDGPVGTAAQDETPDEAVLAARLQVQNAAQQASYSRMRTVQPVGVVQQPPQQIRESSVPTVTATPDPAIITLANNNDLNVSTIAREASKAKNGGRDSTDEVVISLH